MNKRFNLYHANHGKLDGVEDFIAIIKTIITQRGYKVTVSDKLDENAINLIIDEFTNSISNQYIIDFKESHPKSKIYYVLTEFIEEKWFVKSFNFFGGIMDAAPLAAINVYLRKNRKDFISPKYRDWWVAVLYLPLMMIYYLNHSVKNLFRGKNTKLKLVEKLHSYAYLKMRYLGLERMIEYADGVILSHDMIEAGALKLKPNMQIMGTLYPEIEENYIQNIKKCLFENKELKIEVTGSVTPYRRYFIDKINQKIILLGIRNIFKMCEAISFGSGSKKKRAVFSLHPPQNKAWKYASPTRIYRALVYDKNIPVLTKVFNQHSIEKLCLVYSGEDSLLKMYQFFKAPEKYYQWLEPKLAEYMKVSQKENEQIVKRMVEKS